MPKTPYIAQVSVLNNCGKAAQGMPFSIDGKNYQVGIDGRVNISDLIGKRVRNILLNGNPYTLDTTQTVIRGTDWEFQHSYGRILYRDKTLVTETTP